MTGQDGGEPGRPGSAPEDSIARFVAETPPERVPGEAIARARDCVIDTVGCILGGVSLAAGRIAVEAIADGGGAETATVIGAGRRAALAQAAFANAVLASALDFDDGHQGSITHPGAPVIPPAMAAAEARRRPGRDLLAAVVVGYEIAIRAAAALNARPEERSYGSGAPGAYGAAASVARLLGLDASRVRHALSIARCHLPAAPVDRIREGAMTKESVGWGAFTGAMAARLAERGFTGPRAALSEPPHGSRPETSGALLADLGVRYRILEVYVKRFPACLMTHTALEAVLELRRRHGLRADEVVAVTVWTQRAAAALDDPAPGSAEAAQYSIPYTVAAALMDGALGVHRMTEAGLGDRRLLELATRVSVRHDPALDAVYPARRPARVSLRTAGGAIHQHEVEALRGSAEAPLGSAEREAKFLGLAEPLGGPTWARRVLGLLRELDARDDLDALWEALLAPPRDPGGDRAAWRRAGHGLESR
jgi:2-methylcitrate dehydratase PrpD